MSASQKLCSLYTTVTLSDCRKYIITILYINHFNLTFVAMLYYRHVLCDYTSPFIAVDADVV